MSVRVLFFASLRDELGTAEVELALEETISIDVLINRLKQQLPEAAATVLTGENVRIAINQNLVGASQPVAPGDEVAFLPPVTGG